MFATKITIKKHRAAKIIAAVRHNKENMDAVTSRIMALSPGSSLPHTVHVYGSDRLK